MSPRTKKTSRRTLGFTLPPTLKKALVPSCLAALGLAAWTDVPLPAALRPWLALAEQHARARDAGIVVDLAPTFAEAPLPIPATHSATPELPSAAGPAPRVAVEDGLALSHEHTRRVDHLGRARALRELGDVSGALTEVRRALHDEPSDTEALTMAARLARLQGQSELALVAYARMGSLMPEEASALIQQARLLVSLGRHAEAVRVGEEAVVRAPEDAEGYQVLGRAHLASGELSPAILRFQQAVHLEPEHGYALNNLGFAYLRAGEDTKAAEVLARAAELLPHVAYVHNNLGVAWERLGRKEEARGAYAQATRLSPRYVQVRVNADRMNRVARADLAPSDARTPEALSPLPELH
ncbi:tetratricopeptide repeat protein [Myxococcus sp. K38C18041901]|uniref:tetratricopeptide repeat protein n=1 Tax=Myxococcus guangdongensis TaxID=2906760 RepID=UPI0020A79BF5|nr:tetratricopeptide repeat protein [Myxococcus guangdongensis]MCP3057652.1 tetratricopeptide repeat protein [Myxococcus guangdongensis]